MRGVSGLAAIICKCQRDAIPHKNYTQSEQATFKHVYSVVIWRADKSYIYTRERERERWKTALLWQNKPNKSENEVNDCVFISGEVEIRQRSLTVGLCYIPKAENVCLHFMNKADVTGWESLYHVKYFINRFRISMDVGFWPLMSISAQKELTLYNSDEAERHLWCF